MNAGMHNAKTVLDDHVEDGYAVRPAGAFGQ
jgi:hypothetical protein